MVEFSALDSAPVRVGGTRAGALAESLARAECLERLGCRRLWFTEHHLAADVASSSPLTLAGAAAQRTSKLRVGAGGVMIRNHAPLVAAEQAVMLSLLHQGRIDLGLGRAGGSEPETDARIRRTVLGYDTFDDDVLETLHHVRELGGEGVQPFVLASSASTARFAAREGLGLAVAAHVAPAGTEAAVRAYREDFRQSVHGTPPRVVLCLPVLVGESDDEALWWFRSVQQRYLDRFRTGGAPMRTPDAAPLDWSASERYRVEGMLEAAVVGSPETVHAGLEDIARRWDPDEIMAMSDLPDPRAGTDSFRRLAAVVAAVAA